MPDLLTTSEAADYLRQTASTLAHWRSSGSGPQFIRLGRRVVYRKDDLVSYVDSLAGVAK